MGIVQRMSAAALAAMLLTTVIPETQVLAAETTAVETVESQETADTEENATEETAEDQTQGETVIEEAAAADLQDQGTEEVSSRNYALYTETKQAGEEEIASEAQAAEEAAAAQAAQEAAEAAAAQKKAAATAASSSNSGSGYTGRKLTRSAGTVQGPSGKEVYYNMNMSTVVSVLKRRGYSGSYWVRNDGVKMFGDYVMVAANYNVHPYGSIVQTTLGAAIVCDTGTFASSYPNCLDVAVSW